MMRYNEYTIGFENGDELHISAFCEKEAIILAQAEQIKRGCVYDVSYVYDETQQDENLISRILADASIIAPDLIL